jgi:hypothetical protein
MSWAHRAGIKGKAHPNYRHGHFTGGRQTPTYKAWSHMLSRCLNPSNKKYPIYGGRGICVCERWISFESFLEDMGKKPAGTSLGRINNDGDYEPKNCRWETAKQQSNNRSNCYRLKYKGKFYTGTQLAEKLGISSKRLQRRLRYGFTLQQAIKPGRFKTGPKKGSKCPR